MQPCCMACASIKHAVLAHVSETNPQLETAALLDPINQCPLLALYGRCISGETVLNEAAAMLSLMMIPDCFCFSGF